MMALIIIPVIALTPWSHLTNGHRGLLMLALICVGIMLGFPTAFTLMGMGVFFAWLSYRSVDPATADRRVLDLFVQRTYGVMSNDVLIAIPLFLFMGYLVERAQLIDKLFRSLHLATARIPGSLRSEEHTSELQSPCNLVCRLLLEKKKLVQRLCVRQTRRAEQCIALL